MILLSKEYQLKKTLRVGISVMIVYTPAKTRQWLTNYNLSQTLGLCLDACEDLAVTQKLQSFRAPFLSSVFKNRTDSGWQQTITSRNSS